MALNYAESVTANAADLKEYYTNDEVINEVLQQGPLMGLMPKMETFSGKVLPIPLIYGNPQGASALLNVAIANKSNSQEASFSLKRFRDYAVASIEREAKLASEVDGDKGAWLELAKIAIDGARNVSARSVAIHQFRDGSGARGQISSSSNVATTTITLADINDVSNFEIYQYVQFGTKAALRGTYPGNQTQIVSIDRSLGTLTFAAAPSTVNASVIAGDYIFRSGDFQAVTPGLLSWLVPPALRPTGPGVDNFFSVDRYPDKTRLMGIYHDATQQEISEGMIDLERKCAREGAHVDTIIVNNVQYAQLLKSLSSKVVYQFQETAARSANGPVATVSFSGIEFMGMGGKVKVFPDFNCPSTKMFALTMNTWKLYSLNPIPHIFDLDTDQEWLRDATGATDSYEVRCGGYYVVGCRAPGLNGQADLIPAT